ncbi:membrane protein insertion efficiency factor YidD [Clostridium sp. D2Q-11]|uniref:Putative membrane protein insertion efficiency factor n=1 Tax=Anaeromonas frigoriresistens TaxID=2683708 RepID=A0A942UZU4_9FIRM|nr:membrane protein insertion efficiency factor YidD [Anaeromonas frigoriresistens]
MKYIIKKIIILYQRYISPLKGRTCRFYPTCSEYSVQALDRYGLIKGGMKSIWRILRCNPFNAGGYDPIDK